MYEFIGNKLGRNKSTDKILQISRMSILKFAIKAVKL